MNGDGSGVFQVILEADLLEDLDADLLKGRGLILILEEPKKKANNKMFQVSEKFVEWHRASTGMAVTHLSCTSTYSSVSSTISSFRTEPKVFSFLKTCKNKK